MSAKISFKKHQRTVILSVIVTIAATAFIIFVQAESLKNGNSGVWLALLTILMCGVGLSWMYLMQQFVYFYDNGIGFRKYFRQRFVRWEEVERIAVAQTGIIKLEANRLNFRIFLSEYEKPDELVKFLQEKLLK